MPGGGVQLDAVKRMQHNKSLLPQRPSYKAINDFYGKKDIYGNVNEKHIHYTEEQINQAKEVARTNTQRAERNRIIKAVLLLTASILVIIAFITT